jgi:hypothetical protein
VPSIFRCLEAPFEAHRQAGGGEGEFAPIAARREFNCE